MAGYTERRNNLEEDYNMVGRKTKRAVDFGLNVIACIGEHLEENKKN